MRSFRTIVTGSLLALAVFGGSAGAVAAAPEKGTYVIDESWCFDDTVLIYCTEMTGTFRFAVSADGDEHAVTHLVTDVVITDPSGAYVGAYTTRVNDQFRYDVVSGMTIKSVEKTRSIDGDLTCTSIAVLRIADYDLKIDHRTLHCR